MILTSMGIRDRAASIRTCKHPQRQREYLFKFLEELADAVESLEARREAEIDRVVSEHRAEMAALEKRHNEELRRVEKRFTCAECGWPCTCKYPDAGDPL